MTGETQTIAQPASGSGSVSAFGPGPSAPSSRPPTSSAGPPPTVAYSRATRELGLKRGEFDLAVMLGRIRTVADPAGGRRRVRREEIDRVREAPGFPESLRERIKAVGTAEGAALMDITPARFTRLARAGFLTPVKFYVNRYRAVVWLYLAEELRQFAAIEANTALLTGRAPQVLRDRLGEGVDLRARNWRGRRAGFLLRQSEDPWERAAAGASLLDPVQLAEVVRDPYERAYLNRLKPEPLTHAPPESPTTLIVGRITTADDPDELSWLRANLILALEEARRLRPAPRPGRPPIVATPRPHPPLDPLPWPAPHAAPATAERRDEPRGLFKWLRRRRN
ncbi:DUF6397 family protein [Streptomyces lasiicapitis]|uniref:DUF6397 family protein n=1 Tax=Streptomyces lasiicapitis TaxID=1923961 RepID=UPI003664AF96